MKWIKLIVDIALILIPGLGFKLKKDVDQELEIAKATIKILGKDMSPERKGEAVMEAVGNLKAVQGFKVRLVKKLDKARDRLAKKLF